MNVREVLEFAKKHRVQMVDLRFVDLPGVWQHMTIPVSELTEDLFKDGSGLDGSSIRRITSYNVCYTKLLREEFRFRAPE